MFQSYVKYVLTDNNHALLNDGYNKYKNSNPIYFSTFKPSSKQMDVLHQ